MNSPAVDFSYLYELAGNDSQYVTAVIDIFLEAIPPRFLELESIIQRRGDYETIEHQAHFLKSSSSVIKVRDMYNDMKSIEMTARNEKDMAKIKELIKKARVNFNEAIPVLIAEKEKNSTPMS